MNKTSKGKRRVVAKKHPWKRFYLKPRKTQEQLDTAALYFESDWSKNTMGKRSKGKKMGL